MPSPLMQAKIPLELETELPLGKLKEPRQENRLGGCVVHATEFRQPSTSESQMNDGPNDSPASHRIMIADWRDTATMYQFVPGQSTFASGPIVRGNSEVHGFFFRTWSRRLFVCYRLGHRGWLWVDKTQLSLTDRDLEISCDARWPFFRTIVNHPSVQLEFREFKPMGSLMPFVDPTFDSLDWSISCYGGYLESAFLESREASGYRS